MTDKAMPKPCPFCAGDYRHITIDYDDNDPRYAIGCNQCLAEIFPQDTIEKAIAVWNTRPHQEADQAGALPFSDDVMFKFMYELHANVPEIDRPMSWSDFSDEQAERVKAAFRTLQSPPPDERIEGLAETLPVAWRYRRKSGSVDYWTLAEKNPQLTRTKAWRDEREIEPLYVARAQSRRQNQEGNDG